MMTQIILYLTEFSKKLGLTTLAFDKDFDKVRDEKLIEKLRAMGLAERALTLIEVPHNAIKKSK